MNSRFIILFVLSGLVCVASARTLPSRILGMYVLLADDTVPGYTSNDTWQPYLQPTITMGSNTVFFTFINPTTMSVPPAFTKLAKTRGASGTRSIPSTTTILFSIGGESYSNSPNPWPFLTSAAAARDMAAQVATWPSVHGCDGIDFDIESGAGDNSAAGANALVFFQTLRTLNPTMIITQPVFGYPQVASQIYVVNNGWTKNGTWLGGANAVGIMVYTGSQALQYVKNYDNATHQWQGFPIQVNVPSGSVFVGACGCGSTSDIMTMVDACLEQQLGGIMVWYSSAMDAATDKPAIQYSGGSSDAAFSSVGSGWSTALSKLNS